MPPEKRTRDSYRSLFLLAGLVLAGLALHLLSIHWHGSYPLSGDEIGFFEQARTFVQGKGYHDLPFMRAPLYPLFLAVVFRLFGAEVTAARLAQALLGTATVPLLYLWARQRHGHKTGLMAAGLGAIAFAFRVQATFLLTESVFLFLFALGMVLLEWGSERPRWWLPLIAGAVFGLATLTRAIGLPLVVLAALGFALARTRPIAGEPSEPDSRARWQSAPEAPPTKGLQADTNFSLAILVLAGAALVILPWTARNAVVHDAFILVDTTGTTNLWMDNDPELGRDAVKAELLKYPEGERQSLSLGRGLNSIRTHLDWFLGKCWGEFKKFFSLEYFDDFLRRPAIWYPPGEVWARVLLGDGLYLLLVAAGLVGLVGRRTRLKVLDLLWLAYVPATTTLFHVELRYRLPFLLALIPYAAAALASPRETVAFLRRKPWRALVAGLALLAFAGLLLSNANYPRLSWQILRKRVHVALGQRALRQGDAESAAEHAQAGLVAYVESAEARVLLAQALRQQGQTEEAEAVLRQAIDYRSGNPRPHLLLGDLLREQGRLEEAAVELAFENRSLEDLQHWAWENFSGEIPPELDFGSGLELGYVRGWHLPERDGEGNSFRWSDDRACFRLVVPEGAGPARLDLHLAAGRPSAGPGAPPADLPLPDVELWLEEELLGRLTVENGWHTYTLDIGNQPPGSVLLFELRASTFRPHRYDRFLDDNRRLGVMVDWVRLLR